jgi:hypothetical protein
VGRPSLTLRWSVEAGRRKIGPASCFSSLAAVEPAVEADDAAAGTLV